MPHPLVSKFSSSFLDIRESVIETLFLVCNTIIVSRSTNLFVLKDYLPSLLENKQTHVLSHYKRLIRFFNYSNPTQLTTCILKWLYQLLSKQSKYLILDGTTWEVGDKYIHLLTLCIVYKNVAVPIYWKQLNKKGGHSSQEDRKLLFTESLKIFQLSGMILIADREFIGEDWFRYLADNQIDFVVRVSKTCYKLPVSKAWGNSHAYLEKRASKRKSPVGKRFTMGAGSYSFVAVKNTRKDEKEPVLFLVSSLTDFAKIAAIYKVRWKIETCFRQLKTKGFNMEDLNFKDDNKIVLMMSVVVMAYVLSIVQGVKETKVNKPLYKKYRSGQRLLAISLFRIGLSKLKQSVWNLKKFIESLGEIFRSKPKLSTLLVQ